MIYACGLVVAQEAKPSDSPAPTPPQFNVLSQPDAPVHVVSAKVTWALPEDRRGVQVYVVVENAGQNTVWTYTTRRDLSSSDGAKACLGPPRLPAKGLVPGAKAGTSTWQGVPNADPPPTVWVDFVEFLDGTRWGVDECQTGEWIDGDVAGARAQRDQLLEMFREKGADALMTFIRENFEKRIDMKAWEKGERPVLPIWPPSGHSRKWEEGFTTGARGIIEGVITAERELGPDEIERQLLRPVDRREKKSP